MAVRTAQVLNSELIRGYFGKNSTRIILFAMSRCIQQPVLVGKKSNSSAVNVMVVRRTPDTPSRFVSESIKQNSSNRLKICFFSPAPYGCFFMQMLVVKKVSISRTFERREPVPRKSCRDRVVMSSTGYYIVLPRASQTSMCRSHLHHVRTSHVRTTIKVS